MSPVERDEIPKAVCNPKIKHREGPAANWDEVQRMRGMRAPLNATVQLRYRDAAYHRTTSRRSDNSVIAQAIRMKIQVCFVSYVY